MAELATCHLTCIFQWGFSSGTVQLEAVQRDIRCRLMLDCSVGLFSWGLWGWWAGGARTHDQRISDP